MTERTYQLAWSVIPVGDIGSCRLVRRNIVKGHPRREQAMNLPPRPRLQVAVIINRTILRGKPMRLHGWPTRKVSEILPPQLEGTFFFLGVIGGTTVSETWQTCMNCGKVRTP